MTNQLRRQPLLLAADRLVAVGPAPVVDGPWKG